MAGSSLPLLVLSDVIKRASLCIKNLWGFFEDSLLRVPVYPTALSLPLSHRAPLRLSDPCLHNDGRVGVYGHFLTQRFV